MGARGVGGFGGGQEARCNTPRWAARSAFAGGWAGGGGLLNGQVARQAAGRSTNTGRPLANASCTRPGDQGCQPSVSLLLAALAPGVCGPFVVGTA